jgi:hypothetical protein
MEVGLSVAKKKTVHSSSTCDAVMLEFPSFIACNIMPSTSLPYALCLDPALAMLLPFKSFASFILALTMFLRTFTMARFFIKKLIFVAVGKKLENTKDTHPAREKLVFFPIEIGTVPAYSS